MDLAAVVRKHHSHCVLDLLRLRMLARDDIGAPLPPGVAHQVGDATSLILAEAEAAERATLATVAGSDSATSGTPVARFLAARLARLTGAAADAVAAAENGNAHAMRLHLRRFDSLASATWTVQLAMCAPPKQARPSLASRALRTSRV
jgi:hypothetical protein